MKLLESLGAGKDVGIIGQLQALRGKLDIPTATAIVGKENMQVALGLTTGNQFEQQIAQLQRAQAAALAGADSTAAANRNIIGADPRTALTLQRAQEQQKTANVRAGDERALRVSTGRAIVERKLREAAARGEITELQFEHALKEYDYFTARGSTPEEAAAAAEVTSTVEGSILGIDRKTLERASRPFNKPIVPRGDLEGAVREGLEAGPQLDPSGIGEQPPMRIDPGGYGIPNVNPDLQGVGSPIDFIGGVAGQLIRLLGAASGERGARGPRRGTNPLLGANGILDAGDFAGGGSGGSVDQVIDPEKGLGLARTDGMGSRSVTYTNCIINSEDPREQDSGRTGRS